MDQGHMNVSDELTGAITDSALSSFLQIPSNVGTITINSDGIQSMAQLNQYTDPNLKSVGTLYAATTGGQQMSLPLVVSSTVASGNSSLAQSDLHQRLQQGIMSTVSSTSGIKVVLPNTGNVQKKAQPKKTSQGRQRGVSPSVKQMIAQGVRAKRKMNATSPPKIVQAAQPHTIAMSQPVSNLVPGQPKGTVINTANPIRHTVGSDQPVSMSFQTSDGQMITLPVIVKPSPAKDNAVKRTKTKAELKMGIPQTYTSQTGIANTLSNVNINTNVLGAVQNIQTQIKQEPQNQVLRISAQPQVSGNIQIKPQTSTGLQLVGGLPQGARTVAISQNSQSKSQPLLTLQTTDAAGNKVMVPVMLNTLTKNVPGAQIKLVPVGYGAGGAGQSGALQAKPATEISIPSVVHDMQREPQVTIQQGALKNVIIVSSSPNEVVMSPNTIVSTSAKVEMLVNTSVAQPNQVNQGQKVTQFEEDEDSRDDMDTPLVSESVIPWLLAPRGNRSIPLKITGGKKGPKVKPSPSSFLVADMHIKCPCYCPPECTMSHHPLLVALLNCNDDPDENITRQRLQMFSIVFNTLINSLPEIHEPVPDVLNQYRVPLGHWAAALGRVECFCYLLRRGFKVGSQAKRTRETPLHFALRALPSTCGKDGFDKLQQMMPVLGLAALVPNAEGCTSLHVCAELLTVAAKETNRGSETDGNVQFYVKAMSLLLTFTSEKSQDLMIRLINSTNLKGDTALHILAGKDNLLKVVTLLVELGADTEIKNYRGATPLSTAIIAKATKVVGYLTSDNVKRIKSKNSAYKPAPIDPTNPVLATMLQFAQSALPQDLLSDAAEVRMVNPAVAGSVMITDEFPLGGGLGIGARTSSDTIVKSEDQTCTLGQNIHITEGGSQMTVAAAGSSIIQDAAMMSQIAAATSIISQPSAVPQSVNTVNDVKPVMGRPIPSVIDTTASNSGSGRSSGNQASGDEKIAFKKTVLNPPPNSHVIQFIPPNNTGEGKPSAPITVFVNSSDGKPLNLTSNDLLTLTQALQAANIGKDKFPTGPVQVILQQNEAGKPANDLSKKVDEVIDVYQNPCSVPFSAGGQRGANMPYINQKRDGQGRFTSNKEQQLKSQSQPNDINQITLDDLTAILKADEHSGGIDFVTSEDSQGGEVDKASFYSHKSNVTVTQTATTTATKQQYVPVQQPVGQSQSVALQINASSTQSAAKNYPEVGQLLARAPLNASQAKSETLLTRKRSLENSDDTASDTQVIKWAKNDAKLLEGREPNIFPDEAVIQNLNGDEELFEYLQKCDRVTQRDVLASLTDQYLLSQKECDKLNISIQVVDRDIARVEEIHQDTIENMKVLLNKLSDLEEEDKNLSFDSTSIRNEILMCINTQESLRERLTHCDAALAILNDLMKQRNNPGKSKDAGGGDAHTVVISDDDSVSDLSELDSNHYSDVEDDNSTKPGLLRPIAYGENGQPIEETTDVIWMDVDLYNKEQPGASAKINCEDDVELYTRERARARVKSENKTATTVDINGNDGVANEGATTDLECNEGSVLNTTMESTDLEDPKSPTETLPIESLDYQDLAGFGTNFRSSQDDFVLSSQGSSLSSGSSFSSCVAQVVPGSQGTAHSLRGSLYGTQGSVRSSQSSTFSSQGPELPAEDDLLNHQGLYHQRSMLSHQGSMLSSHGSLYTSPQGSIGPDEGLDGHASMMSSQELMRSEECPSSQESVNSQGFTNSESLPNSQADNDAEMPESSQEDNPGDAEIENSLLDKANADEPQQQNETAAEIPASSEHEEPNQGEIVDTPTTSLEVVPDKIKYAFNTEFDVPTPGEITSTENFTAILQEDRAATPDMMESQPLEDLNLPTSQNYAFTASEEEMCSSEEVPDSTEPFVTVSQELIQESMETVPHFEEIPPDSVTMVADSDDFILSQELVTSSQEELPDSQEFSVLTQRSEYSEEVASEFENVIGENEVEISSQHVGVVEVVSIDNGEQAAYGITLETSVVDEELYVMSENMDSENIEYVTEEIQFMTQESIISSQEFAPVSLESNLDHNLDQGLYSQSSVEQGLYSQSSGTLDQDLLVGSQELIEDESNNLIVSQDILTDSQGQQEFVVASSFDQFLV